MNTILPTIADLGRHMNAIDAEHERIDELNTAHKGGGTKAVDYLLAMRVFDARLTAVRNLISTMPAQTLEDVVYQVYVASCLVSDLGDVRPQREMDQIVGELERLMESILVPLCAAAGVEMVGILASAKYQRDRRFAGLESAP